MSVESCTKNTFERLAVENDLEGDSRSSELPHRCTDLVEASLCENITSSTKTASALFSEEDRSTATGNIRVQKILGNLDMQF